MTQYDGRPSNGCIETSYLDFWTSRVVLDVAPQIAVLIVRGFGAIEREFPRKAKSKQIYGTVKKALCKFPGGVLGVIPLTLAL